METTSSNSEKRFRWRCPLCDEEGVTPADRDGGDRRALRALLRHTYDAENGGHGPADAFPYDVRFSTNVEVVSPGGGIK